MDKPGPLDAVTAVKVVRTFKPGEVVFIECAKPLSAQQMQHMNTEFKRLVPEVKVVVLQHGMSVGGLIEFEPEPSPERIAKWRALLDGVPTASGAFEVATEMDEVLRRMRET